MILQILFELAQDGLLLKLAKMVEKFGQKSDRYLPFISNLESSSRAPVGRTTYKNQVRLLSVERHIGGEKIKKI
ncbi:MAG: hypothetical protein F6K54_29225 [Okeania sp. SIO3B5]|uniref:hypothetical protein n=1 Tax=Okeania sp. SIO3B5 TaxID=2607811 RepID=UPI0013FEB42F|nr:hypothetical protein [Okeania sp. SIO3B5]NEO56800.1 hypothetical protein [Okeania sp. SIO3B5]